MDDPVAESLRQALVLLRPIFNLIHQTKEFDETAVIQALTDTSQGLTLGTTFMLTVCLLQRLEEQWHALKDVRVQ